MVARAIHYETPDCTENCAALPDAAESELFGYKRFTGAVEDQVGVIPAKPMAAPCS